MTSPRNNVDTQKMEAYRKTDRQEWHGERQGEGYNSGN
jgi:hypothetical protein